MKKYITIFCVFMMLSSVSISYAQGIKNCKENIGNIIKSLDLVETSIPFVPPEEAAYLEKEFNAWFKEAQKSKSSNATGRRYRALTARPHFYAWELHDDFAIAKNDLQALKRLTPEASLKRKIELASFIPYKLSNARNAWDEYSVYKEKDLTYEQEFRGSLNMGLIASEFGEYLRCLSQYIPE